jgi:hypothetical protein
VIDQGTKSTKKKTKKNKKRSRTNNQKKEENGKLTKNGEIKRRPGVFDL